MPFVQARLVNDTKAMDDIAARTVARIKGTMQQAKETLKKEKLGWRTIDPGAQHLFTGSFQPIFEVQRARASVIMRDRSFTVSRRRRLSGIRPRAMSPHTYS